MYKALLATTVSSVVISAAIPAVAWAQAAAEPAATGETALEQVVVTARRREERLQDVPISVNVVSGSQLEERGVTRLTDLQNAIAGVKVEPQNNKPSTPQITIRGQRMYGVLSAQDAPTAFYFADSPSLPTQGLNSSMHDLASIQVLKGPQGTLFGRNTTGGAVLITPAAPKHELSGALTLKAGDYKTYGAQGYINIPVNETLAVRLAADYQRHGGYDTYASPQPAGSKHAYAEKAHDVRLSVLWSPTDSFQNTAIAYYGGNKNNAIPITIVAINPNAPAVNTINGTGLFYGAYPPLGAFLWNGEGDPRKHVYSTIPQSDKTTYWGLVDTATLDVGHGVTLKNIFSYRNVDNAGYLNINGAAAPYILAYQNGKFDAFTEEFQGSGSWLEGRVVGVAGLFFIHQKADDEQSAPAFYASRLNSTVSPFLSRSINKSYAAYAQSTVKLTDKLAFTAGGRITKDVRKIEWMHRYVDRWGIVGIPFVARCNIRDANGVVLPLSACDIKATKSFTRPTYNLSLDYHITPDLLVYATQRTGHRSGGFYQRATLVRQQIPFRPERVLDREVGVKSEFSLGEARARFNLAYYHDKYKDLQKNLSQFVDGFSISSTFNAAQGTVKGLESDFQFEIDRLTLGGSYAYTKTSYSRFTAVLGTPPVLRDFSDRQFAGVPKNQASLYAIYRLPLNEDIGRVSVSANLGYQSGSFVSETFQSKAQLAVLYTAAQLARIQDDDRPFRTRPYTMVNARVDWENVYGKPIDLALFVRNLTNADPELFPNASFDTNGTTGVGIGPPRTVGAELTYRFR